MFYDTFSIFIFTYYLIQYIQAIYFPSLKVMILFRDFLSIFKMFFYSFFENFAYLLLFIPNSLQIHLFILNHLNLCLLAFHSGQFVLPKYVCCVAIHSSMSNLLAAIILKNQNNNKKTNLPFQTPNTSQ